MKEVRRYSEAFKLQVLRELEEGKYPSVSVVARTYGIRGSLTVSNWIRKYGKTHLMNKVIRVETPKEIDEIKEMRKRVRALEEALSDAHLELKLEKAYTRIACREAGIEDVDAFKKKHAGKRQMMWPTLRQKRSCPM